MTGVKGNGMTLGLTNGTDTCGLTYYRGSSYYHSVDTSVYGQNIGYLGAGEDPTLNKYSLGITTDATKSGIEVKTSSNINYVIKY